MRAPWVRRVLIITVAAVVAVLVAIPSCRDGRDAALLLADLADIDLPFSDPREGVDRRRIQYAAAGADFAGEVYVPHATPRAGLVLVPGAAEAGFMDARLVGFARAVARAGFTVLVPDIVSLRELRLSADNAVDISAAVSHLRGAPYLRPDRPLGIGAFSVAAGPAVLAALDAETGPQVDFLLLVGGYHDLERTLTYLTTGYFEADHQRRYRPPNTYGKWVYALSNASRLQDPSARDALETLARRKLADPAADVSDLVADLGPSGRNVHAFISNTDPDRVPDLIRGLPPAVRADIADLDLAHRDLSRLHAEVILVHGLDDDIIPFGESVSLQAALPPGQSRLYLLEGLHHVDRDIRGADAWRMWLALRALMAERDGAPP